MREARPSAESVDGPPYIYTPAIHGYQAIRGWPGSAVCPEHPVSSIFTPVTLHPCPHLYIYISIANPGYRSEGKWGALSRPSLPRRRATAPPLPIWVTSAGRSLYGRHRQPGVLGRSNRRQEVTGALCGRLPYPSQLSYGLPHDTVYIPIGTPYTRRFAHYRLAPSKHSCYISSPSPTLMTDHYTLGPIVPAALSQLFCPFLVNVHGRPCAHDQS